MKTHRLIVLGLIVALSGCGIDDVRDLDIDCFGFPGPGTDGWTFEGVFDSDSPDSLGSALFQWSGVDGGFWLGSLQAHLTLVQVQRPSKGFWRFDYVSPDLSGRATWQGNPRIMVRTISQYIGAEDPIRAQPIFTYRNPDGTQVDFVPGTPGNLTFYPLAGTTEFRPPTDVEQTVEGAVLERIRIRIFVPALAEGQAAPDGIATVHLSAVCPLDTAE